MIKSKTVILHTTLPKIICVGDYHELDYFISMLRNIGITNVKYKELGLDEYIAVVYIGKFKKSPAEKMFREYRNQYNEYRLE